MSRYTGPRVKVMRALGTELPGLSRKKIERRPFPPGQHGQARRKHSEYGLRLMEKQKLRMNYGLTERQLLGLMVEAHSGKGNTGERLLEFLERRLDNAVFRAGFARTIPGARQLVRHGHITVNGALLDIPSYRIRKDDVIEVREKSRKLPPVQASITASPKFETPWLLIEADACRATVRELPEPTSVLFAVNVQRVVEFYSQRT
jgi:small subunit ribosomal protein S4